MNTRQNVADLVELIAKEVEHFKHSDNVEQQKDSVEEIVYQAEKLAKIIQWCNWWE